MKIQLRMVYCLLPTRRPLSNNSRNERCAWYISLGNCENLFDHIYKIMNDTHIKWYDFIQRINQKIISLKNYACTKILQ